MLLGISYSSSMNTSKGKKFSIEEDQLLCHIYLDVSQDPIHGVNQKKDKIWERITTLWNQQKPHQYEVRSSYSLQSRFSDLSYVISKFRGAVRQVEYNNPSGASEIDIVRIRSILITLYILYLHSCL